MSNQDVKCSACGAIMSQTGSENQKVIFRCKFCGRTQLVEMATVDNVEYWHRRSELLARVRKGVINWETTGWDYLANDIVNFVGRYEAARCDIYLMIATVACITKGFTSMDNEKYKRCKAIFKATEKVYKKYRKDPDAPAHFAAETGRDGMGEYEEYRKMYRKCQFDYRSTLIGWKIAFFLCKRLIPTF